MWELLQKRMKGKANTNWFNKNPQNIVPWRPISFKNEFKKILNLDWSIKIPKESIQSINEDWSVNIKVAKKDAIVMKALNWAMSNKWTESTKMLIWIMEMFEWKAIQKTENETKLTWELWVILNEISDIKPNLIDNN